MATTENRNTEQVIIEAAKQVFIEKGYADASMSDIAARAGINRPALHYYFRTKEKMLQAVYTDVVNYLTPKALNHLQDESVPFFDRVSNAIDVYLGFLIDNPHLPMFGIREVYRDAEHLFEACDVASNNIFRKIKQILLAEMKKGTLKDVPLEYVLYTFYGLLFTPFLIRPIIKLGFDKPEAITREELAPWKAEVISQLKFLLQP